MANSRNWREIEMMSNREEWEDVPLRDEVNRFHYLDSVWRSWLRRPETREGRGFIRTYTRLSLCILVTLFIIVGLPLIFTKALLPNHKAMPPLKAADNYTMALHEELRFFNTQKSGRLPANSRVPWRGNSGLDDGLDSTMAGLVGGFYDSGINIKYNFPQSFAMTMLSWSVLEYGPAQVQVYWRIRPHSGTHYVFNYTRGGLIKLNDGDIQPLPYVVNSAFLATMYANYLNASDTPEWHSSLPIEMLKEFVSSQMKYISGANHLNMSYIVGFGAKFPTYVHHRGASIPRDGKRYSCTDEVKWRDSPKRNPNVITGAMVGGPDKYDNFSDVRGKSDYTEPSIVGNAGLVAALVSLSDSDIWGWG